VFQIFFIQQGSFESVAADRFWPNAADGVQDTSSHICKTHEFSRQAETAPLRTVVAIQRPSLMCMFSGAANVRWN
jgi:hypothetical protein